MDAVRDTASPVSTGDVRMPGGDARRSITSFTSLLLSFSYLLLLLVTLRISFLVRIGLCHLVLRRAGLHSSSRTLVRTSNRTSPLCKSHPAAFRRAWRERFPDLVTGRTACSNQKGSGRKRGRRRDRGLRGDAALRRRRGPQSYRRLLPALHLPRSANPDVLLE